MDELERVYKSVVHTLGTSERARLAEEVKRQTSLEAEDIERNIRRDREHLTVVNFCADKFSSSSRLYARTGYVWIRVEPLYGMDIKRFDLAIYNQKSRTLILIECKSSLREARKELEDLERKIAITNSNKAALNAMVGDDVSLVEFVLCLKAGDIPIAKPLIRSKAIACCLWSEDIFSDTLVLEKLVDDSPAEISAGRLHRDGQLRGLLLSGSHEKSSLRAITFLPSSHMSTILEDIIPRLKMEMENYHMRDFGLRDMQSLLAKELSLQNFEDQEKLGLAGKVLSSALECEIIVDTTPSLAAPEKRFELSNQAYSHGRLIADCHKKYVEYHSRRHALKNIIEDYRAKHPDIRGYFGN